jgi:hypothetical protein
MQRPQNKHSLETKERREQYQAALGFIQPITVSQSLEDPHRIVGLWRADREAAMRNAKGREKALLQYTDLELRRYRILNTLFKELEGRGCKIHASQFHVPWIEIGAERIDFKLYEKCRHVRRPLTDEEKKSWLNARRTSMREEVRTGYLVFKITTFLGSGVPTEWLDSRLCPLEQKLPEILAAFVAAAPVIEANRRRLEIDGKRWERNDRRRLRKVAYEEREDARWERFLELAEQWCEAENARRFLAKLEAKTSSIEAAYGRRTTADWLTWARQRLDAYDPLGSGPELVWQDITDIPMQ